jgi:hypothetical protein
MSLASSEDSWDPTQAKVRLEWGTQHLLPLGENHLVVSVLSGDSHAFEEMDQPLLLPVG